MNLPPGQSLPSKKPPSDDNSDNEIQAGQDQLPPLMNKNKAGPSLGKKPKKVLPPTGYTALAPADNTASVLIGTRGQHSLAPKKVTAAQSIMEKQKNYVSPYSQKAIKGEHRHGD